MGSNGLLSNVHLWVDVLELIEELGSRLQWLWAPSHVGLEGNELAAEGMCQSPLWGVVHSGRVHVWDCNESNEPNGDSTISWDTSSSGNDGQSSSAGREDFEVMWGDYMLSDTASSGSTGASELRDEVQSSGLYAELLSRYEDSEGTECGPSTDVNDKEGYQSRKRARRLLGP